LLFRIVAIEAHQPGRIFMQRVGYGGNGDGHGRRCRYDLRLTLKSQQLAANNNDVAVFQGEDTFQADKDAQLAVKVLDHGLAVVDKNVGMRRRHARIVRELKIAFGSPYRQSFPE
jgi:NAD(P)H-dependent FMN reductase